jgi:hypothetical protein
VTSEALGHTKAPCFRRDAENDPRDAGVTQSVRVLKQQTSIEIPERAREGNPAAAVKAGVPIDRFGKLLACRLWPGIVSLGLCLAAHGAEDADKISQKLKPIPAAPPLVTAATLHHIPLEGMPSSVSGTNSLRPGDSASVLITFVDKKKQTQWILEVEATTPDPTKPAEKPAKITVSSSFGPPMKFESKPAPVRMQMLGPFGATGWKKPPKSELTKAQFSLNEDFLGLGMDQAAAAVFRWSRAVDFSKAVSSNALAVVKPTQAEQRAVCGTFPALMSYFEIVQHTEGLKGLLYKLVELPSLWSMIKHRGMHIDFSFGNGLAPSLADPTEWNLPASAPAYYFPWLVRLNGEPAMRITLVTTSPRPPLLICGGVVGVLLEKIGDDETYMTMRLLSAGGKAATKD